jgi:membrane protease YdiL (CAAX protease family)
MVDKTESKNYPKIKNAVLLCLLVVAIQLGLGGIIGLIIGLFGFGTDSILYGLGIILGQIVSFAVVILIGYKKTGKNFNEVFFINKVSLNYWIAIIVFMFGYVILSSELDNVLEYFLPMPSFLEDTFDSIMVEQLFIFSIILIVIIPTITEEMLFRGIIISGFKENYSEKKTIIVSALLFGLIHLNPWQFVSAFIIGLFSAWLCLRTKSILLCLYIHFFNNLLGLMAMKFSDIMPIKGFNTAYAGEPVFQPLWFDAIGIIITALGILLILRCARKSNNAV